MRKRRVSRFPNGRCTYFPNRLPKYKGGGFSSGGGGTNPPVTSGFQFGFTDADAIEISGVPSATAGVLVGDDKTMSHSIVAGTTGVQLIQGPATNGASPILPITDASPYLKIPTTQTGIVGVEWDVIIPDLTGVGSSSLVVFIGIFTNTAQVEGFINLHVASGDVINVLTLEGNPLLVGGTNDGSAITVGQYLNYDTDEIGYTLNGVDLGYLDTMPNSTAGIPLIQIQEPTNSLDPGDAGKVVSITIKTSSSEFTQPFPVGSQALDDVVV